MKHTYIASWTVSILIVLFLLSSQDIASQNKPEHNRSLEIINDIHLQTIINGSARVEKATGIARAVYHPNYTAVKAQPEEMALQYLRDNAFQLTLQREVNDLQHKRTIETPAGYRVQFVQKVSGYPVYNADIRVSLNKRNEVVFVTNSYKPIINLSTAVNLLEAAAVQIARDHIGMTGAAVHESVEKIVYPVDNAYATVAYLVKTVPAEEHFGDWELVVDASSGEILRAEDKACYHQPDGEGVTGSGWVFDPDPVTNASKAYGFTGFTDNDDADSDSLTAQLKEVALNDITFEDGLYKLAGPNAVIVDVEGPFTGLYEQDSSNFHFTRSQEAFEATQIYYHVDQSMRYLNDSLGFSVMPFQYEGGVQFDPHGLGGDINAHYVGSAGFIAFGSPEDVVDLGEDHAVVLHELGHGIHDWITNGDLSQVDGLSEGLSDYWAQSYTRSLGKYQPDDNGYNWFGVWGGFPYFEGPSLRVTNVTAHYPEDLVGQVHTDGQMWSSSLMAIYDEIGKYATDMNVWEGISMLNSSSSQVDAAMAFIQADRDLFDGDHIEVIYQVFFERGYIEDPVSVDFTTNEHAGPGPLTVQFTDNSTSFFGEINAWEWDLDGDGEIDSHEQNPSFTYENVGAYTVSLRVSDGENTNAVVKANYVIVNGGFFVFESEENLPDHSASYIRDFLQEQGYPVIYSNYFPNTLSGFDAAFLTYGNVQSRFTAMDEIMVNAMIDYLKEGGNIYLEPGVNFLFGQGDNEELFGLFGIQFVNPQGTNVIDELTGMEGTLGEGMVFYNSSQAGNRFIDRYVPDNSGNSQVAFVETGYGDVALQNEGETYGQKTFSFGYALSELADADPQSSRHHLLIRLLEFFGFPLGDNYVAANFELSTQSVLPGETVDFIDWSVAAAGTTVSEWAWDFDMDGSMDSYEQNPSFTFNKGGIYDIMLVASNGIDTDTLIRKDVLAVKSGVLVYDGKKNINGYSGAYIYDYLVSNYYDEVGYTTRLPLDLDGYDAVFLSYGNAGNRSTTPTLLEQKSIESYGMSGGHIYMEGGDVFSKSELLWLIFGLIDVESGSNNPIDMLSGQSESLTQGLAFDGSSQFTNNSIDHLIKISDIPEIRTAFKESDYGDVAVEFDGTNLFGHKAFSMSYALAELQDGEGNNTRDELLARILNFFDVVSDVEENPAVDDNMVKVYPNPGNDRVTMEFSLEESASVSFRFYDMSGKLIYIVNEDFSTGNNRYEISTEDLPRGVYHIHIQTGKKSETLKWIKVN